MRTFLGAALLAATTLLYETGPVGLLQRPAIATTPTVKLVVPDSPVPYGEMIIVQAVVDKAGLPPDLAEYKHQWVIFDNSGKQKPIMVWPDGTQAVFGAGMKSQKFTIILDTDCIFIHKEGEAIQKAWLEQVAPLVATITVGEGPPPLPNPGPGPDPSPTPTPVLPEGQFGLAKFTYDTLSNDGAIAPSDKVKVAKALAKPFSEVAAQIASLATMKDIEKAILPAIAKANNDALTASGVPLASTQSFKKSLGDKIYSMYHDKPQKLVTADDFGIAFREISEGLTALAK